MRKRDYKEFAPDTSYHIYNRGNGKMDIFRDEQDYLNFLKRLRLLLGKTRGTLASSIRVTPFESDDFSLIAYCLMPNHFHLQVEQCGEVSLSSLLLKVCTSYSMYFNRKYDHVGHVFQDQFKAIPVESDNQMAALSAYIHQNPKVAGLVDTLDAWVYSSYPDYIGLRQGDLIDPESVLGQFPNKEAYKSFVDEQYEEILERKNIRELLLD
ncbi:MAG: transposase [Candidatus Paceibacterota bacterium]|jgi:REP element-mobilizing transposase RayT